MQDTLIKDNILIHLYCNFHKKYFPSRVLVLLFKESSKLGAGGTSRNLKRDRNGCGERKLFP